MNIDIDELLGIKKEDEVKICFKCQQEIIGDEKGGLFKNSYNVCYHRNCWVEVILNKT